MGRMYGTSPTSPRSVTVSAASTPLRAARLAAGLSLTEVARRVPMNLGHLSKVERGLEGLSIGSLHRLAEVLGLSDVASALEPYDRRSA
jgi:transcriptional regulator with XRE-family HTH domain